MVGERTVRFRPNLAICGTRSIGAAEGFAVNDTLLVSRYVEAWSSSLFSDADDLPWRIIQAAEPLIRARFADLGSDYRIEDQIAVHRSSIVESGSILKAPAIIGAGCFIAAGAYLRGGTFLADNCTIGPGSELKTSFVFAGSNIAHLNFVGDSILGSNVNVEAGAIIANHRNELSEKAIRILFCGETIETGVSKFGALIGDGSRIGANAVVAPGALLAPEAKVGRLELVDQYPY